MTHLEVPHYLKNNIYARNTYNLVSVINML